MATYLLRRLGIAVATLLALSFLVFSALEALPGDLASRILGRGATPRAVAELNAQLGLDQPFLSRYFSWLGNFLQGDFGTLVGKGSNSSATVSGLLANQGVNSLLLGGVTLLLLVPIVLVVGSVTAVRAGGVTDSVISGLSFVFLSVPEFVVGTVLIYLLSVRLDLLPPLSLLGQGESPITQPEVLVLPVLTLLLGLVAFAGRFLRASMIDVLTSEFVQSARLNGTPERRIVWKIALRSALVPTVQIIAMLVPYLVGGLIIVETVFSYPGIGSQFSAGVLSGEIRLVQAVAVLSAAMTVFANLGADLLVMFLVPKLRPGASR
ncbi:ABC transporter permease [Aeromicrobium fastidiosum]|nr:ABC transporter permease [Aeromicrobium fastidiosum]